MNQRLQKKCLIASAALHLTLLVILFVGPAFLSGGKPKLVPDLNFVPDDVIEAMLAGGGTPLPAQAAPPTPATPARNEPAPAPPPEPRREQVEPPRPVTPERDPDGERPAKKNLPKVSLTPVTRKNATQAKQRQTTNSDSQSKAEDEQRSRIASAARSAAQNVRSGVSSSTSVTMPEGPGGGGRSYAGYSMFVQRVYQVRYDQVLANAGDIAQAETSVEVSVTISRNGNVVSSKIVTPSSNTAQNRLVQRVLDTVTFVRAFPEGVTDSQQTFNISFDLKPKRLAG